MNSKTNQTQDTAPVDCFIKLPFELRSNIYSNSSGFLHRSNTCNEEDQRSWQHATSLKMSLETSE